MLHLLPQGLERPLAFAPDAALVADMLASVLKGWPIEATRSTRKPLVRVSAEGEEILIRRPGDDEAFREPTAVSAVCSLVVEVVDALAAATPKLVCLHAAAAEFGGRLVLFPATHRAGKSTLMARLSAAGKRVFADDILPFDLAAAEAVSTGCLTRLRLPLPRGTGRAFRKHVRDSTVLGDGYYAYVAAPQAAAVRFGERLALGAIVLLDRSARRVPARLEEAAPDTALLEILMRNTRGDRDAPMMLSTFAAIVDGLPARRLVYSDLEDAVACLGKELAQGLGASRHAAARRAAVRHSCPEEHPRGGTVYRRNPAVAVSHVGQAGFLANARDNSIHVLDTLGLGVWNLLETPRSLPWLAEIVSGAFPDMPRGRIAADIDVLLADLAGRGLVGARRTAVGATGP